MLITKHALFRMQQRGIDENNVESAILNPDETSDSFGRLKLARKAIGDKTLEVVYIKECLLHLLVKLTLMCQLQGFLHRTSIVSPVISLFAV